MRPSILAVLRITTSDALAVAATGQRHPRRHFAAKARLTRRRVRPGPVCQTWPPPSRLVATNTSVVPSAFLAPHVTATKSPSPATHGVWLIRPSMARVTSPVDWAAGAPERDGDRRKRQDERVKSRVVASCCPSTQNLTRSRTGTGVARPRR